MRGRARYEVRIRECIEPGRFINGRWIDGRYVKKSKFYDAKSPGDARRCYKGDGYIMWVEKVPKEKLLGDIGEFFKLGDSLLKEFRKGGSLSEQIEKDKEKRRLRRSYTENLRRG